MKFVILASIALVLIGTCYALCAIASDADERAERIYREWKDNERGNNKTE